MFLNYTWLQSTGERQTGGATPLQNFVPRSGSTGLSYTYGRWDARLQLGYNSAFLDNLDSNSRWRDQYKGERYQLDFNGRCKITRQLAVFVNLSNLTSQNYGEFRGNTSAVRREVMSTIIRPLRDCWTLPSASRVASITTGSV